MPERLDGQPSQYVLGDYHRSLSGPEAIVTLIIEVAVAAAQPVVSDAGDKDPSDADVDRAPSLVGPIRIAQSDEGLEATIGFVARQVVTALTDADNPWAELWRTMVMKKVDAQIRRGGPIQQAGKDQPAVRYASRIIRMRLGVVGDPVWGDLAAINDGGFWSKILPAFEADPEMSALGALVRAHIERPGDPIPQWMIEQAKGTWTSLAMAAIGVSTFTGTGEEVPEQIPPPEGTTGSSWDENTDSTTDIPADYEPEAIP
jgi:hypothetical protein